MSQSPINRSSGFDPDSYCPTPHETVVLMDRGEAESEVRYLLAREDTDSHLILSANDLLLWKMFNGKRTVREICADVLEQHQALVLTQVYTLLHDLWEHGMLVEDPHFADAPGAAGRSHTIRLHHLLGWPLPLTARLIRMLGKPLRLLHLHLLPVVILILAFIGVGLAQVGRVFQSSSPLLRTSAAYHIFVSEDKAWQWYVLPDTQVQAYVADGEVSTAIEPAIDLAGRYRRVGVIPLSYGVGLVLLLVLHLFASFWRESFRSAVVAGYTGRAPPLKFVVTYGMPAFRSPTFWHLGLPKWKRLTCACSGIAFELCLASLVLIVLPHLDQSFWKEVLTKLVWVLYLRTFFHLAPFKGSDLQAILGDLWNLRNFRQRAMGFLRKRLLAAFASDRRMAREERIYVTFIVSGAIWFCCSFYMVLGLIQAHRHELREIIFGTPGHSVFAFFAMAFIGIPVLITLVLGISIILHRSWLLLAGQTFMKSPVSFVGVAVLVVIAATALHELCLRNSLMGEGTLATLVYGVNLVLLVGGMYQILQNLPKEAQSYARTKLLMLLVILIAAGASIFSFRLRPGHRATLLLLAVLLVCIGIYLLVSTVKGQHVFARWATPYGPAELSVFAGCVVLAIAGGLQLRALSQGQTHDRFLLLSAVGSGLLVVGVWAWMRSMERIERCGFSLAVSASIGDSRALINTCNYVIDRLGQITRVHFGERAMLVLEKDIDDECPVKNFAFAEPYFPNIVEPGELGIIYREILVRIHASLIRDHSAQFAKAAFRQVFRQVHWQGKRMLEEYVFPDTPWHREYQKEIAVDLDARRAMLNGISMFSDLSDREKDMLIQYMAIERYEPGERIVRQGDIGDTSYIIVAGEVHVEEQDLSGTMHILAFLREGDFFGEAALLGNVRRVASVRATSQTLLLCLHTDDLARFELRSPETVETIYDRLRTFQLLLRIPLFSDLPTNLLRAVLPRIENRRVTSGETIIEEGAEGNEFYLVRAGSVAVSKQIDGKEEVVAKLGAGEYFGEIALLKSIPRTATVRAEVDTEVYVITTEDFSRLLSGSRMFAVNLTGVSETRLTA